MDKSYSVLMSVYQKENPEYFRGALNSMVKQTLPPTDIVLVCDGPLTKELDAVIAEYEKYFLQKHSPERNLSEIIFRVIRLSENVGLGGALATGLKHCQCEWIARMDTDDIAPEYRCELQMTYLEHHLDIDVISGTLAEFQGDFVDAEAIPSHVISLKKLPENHEEIVHYLKRRNPINHPCVMFRKSKISEAGGYQPCLFFEDYDLWIRVFRECGRFANLPDVIHYMRINDMYRRRGGWRYVRSIIHFQTRFYSYHVASLPHCIWLTFARIGVSLIPNVFRKKIYEQVLRKTV